MERLGSAEHAGERLDRGPNDVELRLLRRARASGGLRVEPQPSRPLVLRSELVLHHVGPDAAGRPELRDLLEEIVVGVEEEREAGRKVVHVEAALDRGAHVGAAIGERERELLYGGRSGLADVVPGDGNGVPSRRVPGRVLDRVGHEAQRRPRWVQKLLLGDVLLQDVVLGRAAQPVERDPVRLPRQEVHRPDDVGRTVDRHAGGDVGERDPAEQAAHIVERADVDPALPDLAERLGVVRVEAVEGRVVEGDGEAGLAVGEQIVEPAVRVLGRAEPREHPHRPDPPPVHRRMDSARERRLPRVSDAVEPRPWGTRRVDPIDRDASQRRERILAFRALPERRSQHLRLPAVASLHHRVRAAGAARPIGPARYFRPTGRHRRNRSVGSDKARGARGRRPLQRAGVVPGAGGWPRGRRGKRNPTRSPVPRRETRAPSWAAN